MSWHIVVVSLLEFLGAVIVIVVIPVLSFRAGRNAERKAARKRHERFVRAFGEPRAMPWPGTTPATVTNARIRSSDLSSKQ